MLHSVALKNNPQAPYEGLLVSAYAEGIKLGERRNRLLCPYCHGGSTRERSLSMNAYADGVQWRCWRASCGKKGRLNMATNFFTEGADTTGLEADYKNNQSYAWSEQYKLTRLTHEWAKTLVSKYGLMAETAIAKGWMSNVEGDLVIPLKDINGVIVGHEFRKMEGDPKTLTHLLSIKGFPRNAFDTKKDNKDVVLILEDSISAFKGSMVCRTYSIQGTYFHQQHIDELLEWFPSKQFLLALDKDATIKATEYVRKYSLQLQNFRFIPLMKDLKYYHVAEIEQLLEKYKG